MKKKSFLFSAAFLLMLAIAPIASAYNPGPTPDPGPGGDYKKPPSPICYPSGYCIYP